MTNELYIKSTGGAIQKNLFSPDDRIVSGYYTSDTVDMYGHVIDPAGMLNAIADYKTWGTIREMHSTPIGVATAIGIPEWNFISAKISQTSAGDQVLQLVKDGVYGAFSVGIIVTKAEWMPVSSFPAESFRYLPENIRNAIIGGKEILSIREMTLLEVSIVDRPANPAARMPELMKALTGANSLGNLPSSLDLKSGGILLDGVIVNARNKMIVTESIKSALSTDCNTGDEAMEEKEVVIEESNVADSDIEPVIEADVTSVAEADEEKLAVQAEEHAEEAIVVDSPSQDGEGVEITQEAEQAAIDLSEIYEKIAKLEEYSLKIVESIELLANSIQGKEVESDVVEEDKSIDIQSIIDAAVAKSIDAAIERIPVVPSRKSSVAPVVADDVQEVDIKSMDARSLSRYLAMTAASKR